MRGLRSFRFRLTAWPLGLLATLGAVEGTDTTVVELTNGHRIEGRVVDTSDPDRITIETRSGRMSLPRSLVAHTEPTFEERRARLAADDYAGHIVLARWALTEGRHDDALALVRAVADHPDLDLHGLAMLAQLTDRTGDHERALAWYRRYREAGGKGRRLLQRLEEIEGILADYERRVAEREAGLSEIEIEEGIEAEEQWRIEDPRWANPVTLERVSFEERAGDQALAVRCKPGDKDKAIVGWRRDIDARGSALQMRMSNQSDRSLGVAIAVKTGDDWSYFETRQKALPADGAFHTLTYDLSAPQFKCKVDDWASFSHPLADPERVREVQILIHNGKQPATVLINDVGFVEAESDSVIVE